MAGQIHRIKKTSGFVVLDTVCLKDERLGWDAKGLHSYIMQLPDDWEINIEDLKKRSADKRDATTSAMRQLMEVGYVHRTRKHDNRGRFEGYDYDVFERPTTVTRKPVNGEAENGNTVNGESTTNKNYTLLSTNSTKEEEKKKNAQLEEAFELVDEFFALKAEKEKAPQIAPPPPVADPVGSATDRALEWATQESETIKSWYSTFRVQAPTPEDFKADVFSFFSHYQTAQMELNGVPGMAEKDPVLFFQRRFSSWINNGKSIKKINESRQQKRNYGTAKSGKDTAIELADAAQRTIDYLAARRDKREAGGSNFY